MFISIKLNEFLTFFKIFLKTFLTHGYLEVRSLVSKCWEIFLLSLCQDMDNLAI